MGVYYFIVLAAVLAAAEALVVETKSCGGESSCEVTEVRIEPCTNPRKCTFKKGINATISFDYTPNFAASKTLTAVYWDNGAGLSFTGMASNDGCDYTPCPLVPGTSQTLVATLAIHKKLPKGTFPIKWVLSNEEDDTQFCCFRTTIELKK